MVTIQFFKINRMLQMLQSDVLECAVLWSLLISRVLRGTIVGLWSASDNAQYYNTLQVNYKKQPHYSKNQVCRWSW